MDTDLCMCEVIDDSEAVWVPCPKSLCERDDHDHSPDAADNVRRMLDRQFSKTYMP